MNKGLTSGAMGEGVDDVDISNIQDLFLSPPPYITFTSSKNLLISIWEYIYRAADISNVLVKKILQRLCLDLAYTIAAGKLTASTTL